MGITTAAVSLAVAPTVVSTFFSHYLKRSPLRQLPTAHLPYDQGLHLIRTFLIYASHHTIEDVQAFMSQKVPVPIWTRVEDVAIPTDFISKASTVLEDQLGPEGIRLVGGHKWWLWRKPLSPLKAEWIEMRSHYAERQRRAPQKSSPARRVMFYVHGGAYFMGSVDAHRYQLQRHARKLKARVFAPRYRLAPQFPFPCGLLDCLSAYLYLLSLQENDASTIVLAGDSAGGGMVLSLLTIMRDRGIPMPAGAILISPWVDLTHSFPSLTVASPMDYIPPYGFHQRPSMAWPPPSEEVLWEMHAKSKKARAASKADQNTTGAEDTLYTAPVPSTGSAEQEESAREMFASNNLTFIAETEDGPLEINANEQIQLYTTNNMLSHPLVSPALQPTLGGLPPLLIIAGGGEILRDEQMFVAHKCANPAKYAPLSAATNPEVRALVDRYPPTDVQLQVWDDLCHVATTLSFTRPAKFMFRSIAQFGAWALARAQNTEIDIQNDGEVSVISSASSDENEGQIGALGKTGNHADDAPNAAKDATVASHNLKSDRPETTKPAADSTLNIGERIGKAGDPLPPFVDHMIRQRVTRHGDIYALAPETELPGTKMALEHPEYVGVPKLGPVRAWTKAKKEWDSRYSRDRSKVLKQRMREAEVGFETFGNEHPPPSSMAAHIRIGQKLFETEKHKRNYGLALWSLWGSKHDESTVEREYGTVAGEAGARVDSEHGELGEDAADTSTLDSRLGARVIVRDEQQTAGQEEPLSTESVGPATETTAASNHATAATATADVPRSVNGTVLTAHDSTFTGVTGKRPFVGGIASPFSLNKEADTASMKTLHSTAETEAGRQPSAQAPVQVVAGNPTTEQVEEK